jgi:hypothetical protein
VTNLIVNNYVRLGNLTGGAAGGAATNSFSIGSAVMVHGNIVSGGASANIVNLTNGFLYAGGKIGSVSGTNDGPLYALNVHSGSIMLDLGASGNPATAVCSVSNLWINTLTLNVKGTGLSEGVVPLIKCFGTVPTGNGFRGITPGTLAVNSVGSFSNSTDTLFLVMSSRPRIAAASRSPNGSVGISGTGVPATTYRVLASEDLAVPIGSWSQVGTVTTLGDGTYNFTDTTAASYSRRFYQLVRP